MAARPTGTLAEDGRPALRPELPLPAAETWAAITDPDRTARWFGPWSGDAASGEITVTMTAEEGDPSSPARVIAVEPRHRLVVETVVGEDAWRMELRVEETAEGSAITLLQQVDDGEAASMIGPGWEFYLDRLVAAETGGDVAAIAFEPDYYPGQAEHFRALFTA